MILAASEASPDRDLGPEPATPAGPESQADQTVDDRRPSDRESGDGREANFEIFFKTHFRPLMTSLAYMGATITEAEDITADTMAEVYRRWGTIESPRAFANVVAQRALIKSRRRARDLPSRLAAGGWLPDVEEHAEPEADPLEANAILGLIERLPARQRAVIALLSDGYTSNEIAEHLRIAPSSVRVHLQRARQILRTQLARIDELEAEHGAP